MKTCIIDEGQANVFYLILSLVFQLPLNSASLPKTGSMESIV